MPTVNVPRRWIPPHKQVTRFHTSPLVQGKVWSLIGLLVLLLIALPAQAEYYPGYTLFTPNNSTSSYLLDQSNNIVHSWSHTVPGGYSVYLLENSHLLRTARATNPYINGGGGQGIVQEVDWDGNVVWQYSYSSNSHLAHHDIEVMPNGNVLMIAWEVKSSTEARQAGFNRSVTLWPDHIVEVEPSGSTSGEIVWEWHAWDHLIQDYDATKDNYGVVGDHPELLDINMSGAGGPMGGDWMHANGISYNPDLDQIALTSHTFDEVYLIDHSTTTEEAASHSGGNSGMGGDIIYRWGKPANFDASGTSYFNVVHCPYWIPQGSPGAGHLMVFNNREGTNSSEIVELILPEDGEWNYEHEAGQGYGPTSPTWNYSANDFYSNHLGACQRLPNGNTLVCESTSGFMFEVDSEGNRVWQYDHPVEVVRVLRYGVDYPGVYTLNQLPQQEIALNEMLLLNEGTGIDPAGDADAWLELYNNGDVAHSLAGFSLSSSPDSPGEWTFPDTTIAAGEFLIVWLDGETEEAGLHTSFTLSSTGGTLTLFAPDQTVMDDVSYPSQNAGVSYGRLPDGTGDFTALSPTFATENSMESILQDRESELLPIESTLRGCYPNPFNATTVIRFDLKSTSNVKLTVYNMLGQRIAVLLDQVERAGSHEVVWDGRNDNGLAQSSGSYVIAFVSGKTYMTEKVVLVK